MTETWRENRIAAWFFGIAAVNSLQSRITWT
jgi:hypothetical protein